MPLSLPAPSHLHVGGEHDVHAAGLQRLGVAYDFSLVKLVICNAIGVFRGAMAARAFGP